MSEGSRLWSDFKDASHVYRETWDTFVLHAVRTDIFQVGGGGCRQLCMRETVHHLCSFLASASVLCTTWHYISASSCRDGGRFDRQGTWFCWQAFGLFLLLKRFVKTRWNVSTKTKLFRGTDNNFSTWITEYESGDDKFLNIHSCSFPENIFPSFRRLQMAGKTPSDTTCASTAASGRPATSCTETGRGSRVSGTWLWTDIDGCRMSSTCWQEKSRNCWRGACPTQVGGIKPCNFSSQATQQKTLLFIMAQLLIL